MNCTRHVECSDRSEQLLYVGKMEFGFELELELALRTDIDKGLCWLCCMHGIGESGHSTYWQCWASYSFEIPMRGESLERLVFLTAARKP